VGVKVTVMVQVFWLPNCEGDIGQLLVSEKSPGSAPVMVMAVMVSALDFDPLVSVVVIGELLVPTVTVPKLKVLGDSFTAVPVPVRETVWGLPVALSVMEMVPVTVPTAPDPGVNVTEIVQLAPAATLVPQVLVSPKFVLGTMLVMVSGPLPVLVRVTV